VLVEFFVPIPSKVKRRLAWLASGVLHRTVRPALFQVSNSIKYDRVIKGRSSIETIRNISIEFCQLCNLRCKYCNIVKTDRARFLDINLYERLLKELCENSRYCIRSFEWPIGGEFVLHPKAREIITMTRRYMDRFPQFRPWIILNTNLTLMKMDTADFILGSNVVNQMILSIDGRDKESFEDMRRPAKYETVIENAKYIIEKNEQLGHPVVLEVNNGTDDACRHRNMDPTMMDVLNRVDHVRTWHAKHFNDSFPVLGKRVAPAKGFCSFVFENVTISSGGSVIKCCMDLGEATKYGDLNQNTLEEIWNSAQRKHELSLMRRGKREKLPGCSACTITDSDIDNTYRKKKVSGPLR
jgi:radical SAM protein with 4Fe4S-binding SPASM domain